MARILEHRTWQDYNKYSKERSWCGVAKIDVMYKTDEEYEARIKECYKLNTQRWQKVMKATNSKHASDVPLNLIHQLSDQLAGDLREASGKRRSDAADLNPPKRIDMVKLAYKLNIIPGDNGWESAVIKAIEEDRF